MTFLNQRQQHSLAMICDTLVPSLTAAGDEDVRLFAIGAADVDLGSQLEEALEEVTDDQEKSDLKLFLFLLELPWVNALIARKWMAFSKGDLAQRTAILGGWRDSPLMLARQGFQVVKRLSLFIFYAHMPDDQPNPTWPVFGYAAPARDPQSSQSREQRPIVPIVPTQETTLEADVLVIGSGAGGGVMAGELSAAGLDVLVVEKGSYYADHDFHGRESDSMQALYENYGALTTKDISMVVLAGDALGGGTIVNWMTSLRPPESVLQEWATDYDFGEAASAAMQSSLDEVWARLNINTQESEPNRPNALLEKGSRALGYEAEIIPRNVRGCETCDYCMYGCVYGAKQSGLKTYLRQANEHGARFLVDTYVDRILHKNGAASGAMATLQGDPPLRLTLKAKLVVVAAGSIHTPAILMRSGLRNRNIGKNLHFHPTTVTVARYEEAVRGWEGPPQTRVMRDLIDLDGQGYGVWLEVAVGHPGLSASTAAWLSGRHHKRAMQDYEHLANNIILVRDYHAGEIKLKKNLQPAVHYVLHPYDARHLMQGLLEGLKIHHAAGAREIISPHSTSIRYREGQDSFETFLERVQNEGLRGNSHALFSAHQMSSCRIAGDARRGAVKPSGETYELKNLYVADGSVFPTAVGVNPMVSILGVAHLIAQQIKGRL